MNPAPTLVLASQSPRRRQILAMLGFRFETAIPPFEEVWPEALAAGEVPGFLARGKALSVAAPSDQVVFASDTVVVLGGEVLGKPADEAEAFSMLRRLNGKTHTVYTGIAAARAGKLCGYETVATEVDFAKTPESWLKSYARHPEPRDKAGSYAIQGLGAAMVAELRGCFYNVMGLPVQATLKLLASQGIFPELAAGN